MFKNLFLRRSRFMISLVIVLLVKGPWFTLIYLFLKGPYSLRVSWTLFLRFLVNYLVFLVNWFYFLSIKRIKSSTNLQLKSANQNRHNVETEGACIKYVGEEVGGFYKFLKKNFTAQGTIKLNISWPSNFFSQNFMTPLINFSF